MTEPMSPAELIEAYQRGLWRYLRFLGCSDGEADDLVQETFLAALRNPFEQRGKAQTGAFLRRVARNQYLMLLRRQRRESAAGGIDPARQALDMRYRDGLSRNDMATRLEMAADGIKTLLRRTRDTLRDCIQRRIKQ